MAYHPFRHLGLKIVALVMATVLWFTVAGEHVVERIIRIPVELRNIPPELEVLGDPPESVDVRLRGSSATLSRLMPGEVIAVVDLGGARPGSRLFPIAKEHVRAPFGLEVSQVVPGTIGLELEKSARRVVPVIASLEGEPAPGFVAGQLTVEPATVEVVGPESRVRKLSQAMTEPVNITGASENVRDVVTVGVIDAAVRLVEPHRATVIVNVMPAPVERQLSGVPVRARNIGHALRARLAPETVAVQVRGRRETVAGLSPDAIDVFVDLDGLGAGRYNLRVQVDPSQPFGVSALTPEVVDVTLR